MQVFTPSHKVQSNPLWRTVGFPSSSGPHLNAILNEGLPITIVDKIQHWSTFGKGDILRIAGAKIRSYSRRCSGKGKPLVPPGPENTRARLPERRRFSFSIECIMRINYGIVRLYRKYLHEVK